MTAVTTVLAISGSLRVRSSNTELLRACAELAPPRVRVELYTGLAELPHFNADLDTREPPAAVAAWRARIAAADALLVSSPEYARGVPGTLKNALDWLVGGSEIVDKPVALLNGSPRATHAQASLALTLRTMSAHVIRDEPYLAPVLGTGLEARGIIAEPTLAAVLRAVLHDLASAGEIAAAHGQSR
jgi:chromate reductase, NAD(P)H dehydrogenase (quinone)